ncbi:RNA polymerase-binding protein DksA [Thiohalomonas denitrificans]|uniref:RNA polymerase-binding protein DksA n=1 Tax=Thiohalomonas denitrificans TaxID=415747 RepID=UPI0026F2DF90|nr:RNA polymerase-binding protein DksA [Thiohalomonas denitrificans]
MDRKVSKTAPTETSTEAGAESYMDEEMLARFREQLIRQRDEVRAHLERALEEPKHHPEALPDEGDQASREAETEMELQEINRQRNQLHEIEAALRRLDKGEYGYCEACGLEIGLKRLNVRPVATLCIDCKSLEEVRNRR